MAREYLQRRLTLQRVLVVMLLAGGGVTAAGPAHADGIRDRQWHLNTLDAMKAHKITRGADVTVAVLDSGVDAQHPDLDGAVLEGKTYAGQEGDYGWGDADGHGTAMASLIAGHGHGPRHRDGALGIAPEAKILPIKVGSGDRTSSQRGIENGIQWAADHGADIISISVGASEGYLRDALDYARRKGVVIVASAGNTANGDDEVGWPAAGPGVIAVSATGKDGEFTDASASGPEMALAAPGVDIVTAATRKDGGYSIGTGTSASAAIVAGVAALVKSRYPDLDAANVINRLISTADDRGPNGRDPEYGFGVVNPVKALTADVPEVSSNPLLHNASPTSGTANAADDSGGLGPAGITLTVLGGLAVLAVVITVAVLAVRRRSATPRS